MTLTEILQAREDRALRQKALLAQFGKPLLCYTMNIAGPEKTNPRIEQGFRLGLQMLEGQLLRLRIQPLHREVRCTKAGNEAFFVADLPPDVLKALAMELEDQGEFGRLLDLDVLTPDGRKLERTAPRGCLICGKPGKSCARSRAHSVGALQEKTEQILRDALSAHACRTAAELACRALLYEACTAPKPGLVDRCNRGSHTDMDLFTFLRSTAALTPYFSRCVQIGQQTAHQTPSETFAALQEAGRMAEGQMLLATGGVNTHRGAVFTMGTICGALGRLPMQDWKQPERIARLCAEMTAGLIRRDLASLTEETASTVGERLYVRYGITGIRGQMEQGLPAVLDCGLPVLEQALSSGKDPEQAGVEALLALMTVVEDTNLIGRAGPDAWKQTKEQAAQLLESGVTREAAARFDDAMIRANLSPGGSADLLAVCYLFHFLRESS